MQLQHSLLQLLRLAHHIGHQPEHVQAGGFLHRLFQIDALVLKRPHGHARFRRLAEPTGCGCDVLNAIELGLLLQHPAQVLLLGFRQPRQFPHQWGHGLRGKQILLRALANLIGQERTGGGREFIGQAAHLLPGDLLTLVGRLADHLLHLRISLSGFHKGALREVVDAALLQQPVAHQAVSRFSQLDQAVGPGLADFPLPEPLQEASPTALATTLLAIPHRRQDPSAPNFGLQVKAVAQLPGLLQAGVELQGAEVVLLGIGQVEMQRGCLKAGWRSDQSRSSGGPRRIMTAHRTIASAQVSF